MKFPSPSHKVKVMERSWLTMTVLPLKLDGYRIVDAEGNEETDAYKTKEEAESVRRGLTRFYEENPTYLNFVKEKNMTTTEAPLKLTRERAVQMFESLGLKTAGTWNKVRMSEKLQKLAESYDDDTRMPDPLAQETFNAVMAAIKNGAGVELVSSTPSEQPAAPQGGSGVSGEMDLRDDEPKKEEAAAPSEGKKAEVAKPKTPEVKKIAGVRPSTTCTPYLAGKLLKEFGIEGGVTEELIKKLDEACESQRPDQRKAELAWAWHCLRGFLGIE